MKCSVCGSARVETLTTYKSLWHECADCGCAAREQRSRYPLEWAGSLIQPVASGRLRAAAQIIGRKAQGVDVYRGYENRIERFLACGERDYWTGEYEALVERLATLGISLTSRKVLDISGEPGFFALDAQAAGTNVVVTAYADNVAEAMKRLGVETFEFDFNRHSLCGRGPFDAVLSRYNIGFCEDIPKFLAEVYAALSLDGILVVQHSPYSRAMPVRWMFDDYTYLRAFSSEYLKGAADRAGLRLLGAFDEGRYRYNAAGSVWWPARLAATLYRAAHPRLRRSAADEYQYNETLVWAKKQPT